MTPGMNLAGSWLDPALSRVRDKMERQMDMGKEELRTARFHDRPAKYTESTPLRDVYHLVVVSSRRRE